MERWDRACLQHTEACCMLSWKRRATNASFDYCVCAKWYSLGSQWLCSLGLEWLRGYPLSQRNTWYIHPFQYPLVMSPREVHSLFTLYTTLQNRIHLGSDSPGFDIVLKLWPFPTDVLFVFGSKAGCSIWASLLALFWRFSIINLVCILFHLIKFFTFLLVFLCVWL